jgi:hypothetical protein
VAEIEWPWDVTIKAVNQELGKHEIKTILVNGGGYFFFRGLDVNAWLDRTVQVSKISDLSLDGWLRAFNDLKRKNQEIARAGDQMTKRGHGDALACDGTAALGLDL